MRPQAQRRPDVGAGDGGRRFAGLDHLYRMDALELASGLVLGHTPVHRRTDACALAPRAVLEEHVAAALGRLPCAVAFSGGRDSSALLALATDLARRHGLPLPVPVTRRYVDDPAADESEWQELVIRHLGLTEWIRIDVRDDCDLLGPHATRLLRRHGVLWPPTAHVMIPTLEVARGGTLITGEGGDEVFGPRRATPLRHLAGGRRRRRTAVTLLADSLGPRWLRRRALCRRTQPLPWLTVGARAEVDRRRITHQLDEPLSWRRSTRQLGLRRGWVHGAATMQHLAAVHDVALHHPLLQPAFLGALADSGTLTGPLTRAEVMRGLFGRLLPDEVIRRRSKATFNTTLFGPHSRRFADAWSGDGIDTGIVDTVELTRAWRTELPDGRTFALLQAAWLNATPAAAGPA